MSDIKVSIIVPCWSREKSPELCLLSLQTQKILKLKENEVEIIVVFNGEDLRGKYTYSKVRIKVTELYSPKESRSNARNIGIDNSKGEYILFLDADCTVSKGWLEGMYLQIINKKCDIVNGITLPLLLNSSSRIIYFLKNIIFKMIKEPTHKDCLDHFSFDSANFIVKRNAINYKFQEYSRFEDHIFSYELLQKSKILNVVASNMTSASKYVDETLISFVKNQLLSVFSMVIYNFNTNGDFDLSQYHKGMGGLLKSLWGTQNKNKFPLHYLLISYSYCIFLYFSFLVSYVYCRMRPLYLLSFAKTITNITFLFLGTLMIITMYLPKSSFKTFLESEFSFYPPTSISFWEIYSGDGVYFSDVYSKCQNENEWRDINKELRNEYRKRNDIISYKNIIRNKSIPYFLMYEGNHSFLSFQRILLKECDNFTGQLRIDYKNILGDGKLESITKVYSFE